MAERGLFDEGEPGGEGLATHTPAEDAASREALLGAGVPRVKVAVRDQKRIRYLALDELLPADDVARVVLAFVEQADLSELYGRIRAFEGSAGQSPIDPKILLCLWLLATIKGISSAREIARRCESDRPFEWICGEVSVNDHSLSDFRTAHPEFLDGLLTEQIAGLMHAGLVTLERVAQDGVRVRASAGASSFRREPTLQDCLAEAQEQVAELHEEAQGDQAAPSRRQKAARERAAREREQRLRDALTACAEVQQQKTARGGDSLKYPARASTTDPDARNMKMPDGGFRPAFNGQFATDADSQVIVGVDATTQGTDAGLVTPMVKQIEERTGRAPDAMLVDGGFSTKGDIQALNDPAEGGPKVFAPVKDEDKKREKGQDPFAPLPTDTPARAEWRQRMGTAAAKEIYKDRASTAECVNALARQRGLTQFRVRGRPKVKTMMLWYALAHNLLRWGAFVSQGLLKVT